MSNGEPPRTRADRMAADGSMLYLLVCLGISGWLLFDTWIGAHSLPRLLGYDVQRLQEPLFHLIANTVIGGAIGGIVNGLRSAMFYYTSFDRDYFWKYIVLPWKGAALALIGFALLRSSVAIFGGNAATVTADTAQNLATFAIGALAGYGSRDVFTWLDEKVSNLFHVTKKMPKLEGQPQRAAENQARSENLPVGTVSTTPAKTEEQIGKVVTQYPAAGEPIQSGKPVELVVATNTNGKKHVSNKKAPKK